jgi:hypothetical protein
MALQVISKPQITFEGRAPSDEKREQIYPEHGMKTF